MRSFWVVFLMVAYLVVLLVLGTVALRKCRPEDIPAVLRALFGRNRTLDPSRSIDKRDAERHDADGNEGDRLDGKATHQRHTSTGTTKSYAIPLIETRAVTVEGEFPITERDWTQFMAVLTVMKPGLVRDDSPVTDDAG
jgi:hypothetical protein